MIRINLAPPSSLLSKVWFVPELTLFILIFASVSFLESSYLSSLEDETREIQASTASTLQDLEKLHADIERFAALTKQVEAISDKLKSIEGITISKVGRYLPIIVLEYLQTMKPLGMWFNTFQQDSKEKQIQLTGHVFDTLLVSEFINSIESTKKMMMDPRDIKSYVYFPNLILEKVSTDSAKREASTGEDDSQSDVQKAFKKTVDLKKSDKMTGGSTNTSVFPELDKFPSFSLLIKYSERGSEIDSSKAMKPNSKPNLNSTPKAGTGL